MKIFNNWMSAGNIKSTVYALFLIVCVATNGVQAGQVSHFRMDYVHYGVPGAMDIGEFFTFSVDDKNGDGIATSDEIFDFSGIACNLCLDIDWGQDNGRMSSTVTTLGRVETDIVFGGSGEAEFNLTTFDWTYIASGASDPFQNGVHFRSMAWSDSTGTGTPFRQFAPKLQVYAWSVTVVSDPTEVPITQESLDLAQQMYIAYYGRPGDPGGRNFWAGQFDESNNLDAVLFDFGNSDEFNESFDALSLEELVNGLFQQMFSRDSDPEGLAFYVSRLTPDEEGNIEATLASIAKQIADGAVENDLIALNNKISVANEFTSRVENEGFTYNEDDIANIRALLKAVSSGEDSQTEGLEAVSNWEAD